MEDDKDNQPAVNSVVILDFLDDETGEDSSVKEGNDVPYERLYAFLLENEDILITVDEEDVEDLRRGISVSKYVNNKKLKDAGASQDTRQIDFKVVERLAGTDPIQVRLQIWLKAKKSVYLHRLVVSDKGL